MDYISGLYSTVSTFIKYVIQLVETHLIKKNKNTLNEIRGFILHSLINI